MNVSEVKLIFNKFIDTIPKHLLGPDRIKYILERIDILNSSERLMLISFVNKLLTDMIERAPQRVIELAVKGMLPKTPLGRTMYRKLKVYAGAKHQHAAQQPQLLEL